MIHVADNDDGKGSFFNARFTAHRSLLFIGVRDWGLGIRVRDPL